MTAAPFSDRLALITGHSRGLGAALASQLLLSGWSVLGLSRSAGPSTLKSDAAVGGGTFSQISLDLGDLHALQEFLLSPTLQDQFSGRRTVVLFNNAGLLAPVERIGRQGASAIVQAVSVNVAAALALTDAVVACASDARCRDLRIVQISSGAARSPYEGWSVYCATKAALDHHSRCFALEASRLAPMVTRVCSLAPGVIDTEMQAEVRSSSLEAFPMRAKFDDLKATGGLVAPEEVATRLIAHVMSEVFGAEPVADLRHL